MSGEPITTITGNLTADPELRFTPAGVPVANFTVASTPRTFDRQSGEWKDGEPIFMAVTAWRALAENAAESLAKGMRVIVAGRLRARTFETRDGDRRTVIEMDADDFGPSLMYATAKVARRSNGDRTAPPAEQDASPAKTQPAPRTARPKPAPRQDPPEDPGDQYGDAF